MAPSAMRAPTTFPPLRGRRAAMVTTDALTGLRRTANRIAHRVEQFEPPVAGDLGHRHHGAEGGLFANDRNPIEAEPVQYNESAVRALAIIQFRNGEGAARYDHGTLGLQRWNKAYLSGRLKHDGHCNLPNSIGA